ncbi:hypothetical protein COT63_00945 [Candidatus Shapirobacteria bacterium CG09_land_8_20_14_0_10_38_17]|uniref:Zinc-ribbon domain-containing protein n=1 Tax=Candidatus Shapirobacteria bacterium CG09_land_8_20_14_0_10_38_17 TaxID=1974884 RepID=A0A2H0WRJ4_9BACT|nr:MAG: hypothetical protein COT63_00945 [Candidatus Shapirobacteria bacterium CG09_land_8_20_14_0_10_38_17]
MKKRLFLLIIGAFFLSFNKVSAQQALPSGGDSFETAVYLSVGDYQGGTIEEGGDHYYFIDNDVKPGQEIQTQVLFSGNTNLGFFLYDRNRTKLTQKEYIGENDNSSLYWLNGAPNAQKYYFRIRNQAINVANLKTVRIKITDRFDAGSQTDAGGLFESALPIEAGQYKGFLDFNYDASDKEDFYKINVARGQKLTVKVTPPQNLYIGLKIYDKDRSELVYEYSENEGAIITGSIQALTTDTFYIVIFPEYGDESEQASQYSLDISGAGVANVKEGIEEGGEALPDNPLAQISASVPGGISGIINKGIRFILLIIATVLIIIVVTVILLVKGKSGKKETPQEETPTKTEKKENKKEEETVKPEFIYCPKCGAKNPSDAQFCSKCGEKLK